MTARCTHSLRAGASFVTALASALSVIVPIASAQTAASPSFGAPTSLLPPSAQEGPSLPGSTPAQAVPPPSTSETVIGGIRIDELAPLAVGNEAIGTINGLGPDLWRGASRALIAAYLPRLPAPIASPSARDLARLLLLTSAAPPPSPPGATENLLALRLERLAAMGDADNFIALARAIPKGSDEAVRRSRIEAALLAGDEAAACADVESRDASLHGPFWNRAAIVCDVVGGRTAQAQLALDLMAEKVGNDKDNKDNDAEFAALLRAALGDRRPIANLSGVGPLETALLRRSKAEVGASALAEASALAIRTVALSDVAWPVRLDAAERAEAVGAISTAKLAEAYAAVPLKKDELANALTLAGNDLSPRGRALFFQAEQHAKAVPAASAEVLKAALDSAREQGRFAQAARVYAAEAAAIDPAPELAWFAADAARVSYAVGATTRAEEWRAVAARGGDGAAVDAALWPLSAIATVAKGTPGTTVVDSRGIVPWDFHGFDAAGFQSWLATIPEPDRARKAAFALTLLDAVGASVPAEIWAPFLNAIPARSSPLVAPLVRAADGGRIGETVLLSLVALGSGDADKWAPETTSAVASALVRINRSADARALALESAIAADL